MCENAYKRGREVDVESHHSSTLFSKLWSLNQIQSSSIWLVSLDSLHCLQGKKYRLALCWLFLLT